MVKLTPTAKALVVRRTTKAMATATTTISEAIDYVRIRSGLFCVAPEANIVTCSNCGCEYDGGDCCEKSLGKPINKKYWFVEFC